jgi:hypothetical protein
MLQHNCCHIPFLRNSSERSHLDPKLPARLVRVSFVWESKVGLSIRALTNTHMWFLIWKGLTPAVLFFLFTTPRMWLTIWSVTYCTCVPPLIVAMLLQKLTCHPNVFQLFRFFNCKVDTQNRTIAMDQSHQRMVIPGWIGHHWDSHKLPSDRSLSHRSCSSRHQKLRPWKLPWNENVKQLLPLMFPWNENVKQLILLQWKWNTSTWLQREKLKNNSLTNECSHNLMTVTHKASDYQLHYK